jgi:hypothetical protein
MQFDRINHFAEQQDRVARKAGGFGANFAIEAQAA